MGIRLHVAKKSNIEFALPANFTYELKEFHDLLLALNVVYSGELYDSNFEIYRPELQKGIEKLKNSKNLEEDEQEDIDDALRALRESKEEVIEYLELFLEHSDQTNDYIYFSVF